VRQAVAEGNRPGDAAGIEPRGSTGYQGAGPKPITRFAEELAAAGGFLYLVPDTGQAVQKVLELLRERSPRSVVLGSGPVIDKLNMAEHLQGQGLEVVTVSKPLSDGNRDGLFRADVAVSGVAYLIAETGSVVVRSSPSEPRSLTLLPPVHIAVANGDQILPDLFDLFEKIQPEAGLPSGLTLITGPSKTGDIELKLVTGVHGPGEVHVVLIEN
jgi:L-lactate utilization protein LutC